MQDTPSNFVTPVFGPPKWLMNETHLDTAMLTSIMEVINPRTPLAYAIPDAMRQLGATVALFLEFGYTETDLYHAAYAALCTQELLFRLNAARS